MIPASVISELKKVGMGQVLTILYHSDGVKNEPIKRTKFREKPENNSIVQDCVRVFTENIDKFDDVVINAYYAYENRKTITSFNVYGLSYQDGVLHSQTQLL